MMLAFRLINGREHGVYGRVNLRHIEVGSSVMSDAFTGKNTFVKL